MYEYERCINGSYFSTKSGDAETFLRDVLMDVSGYALSYLPWDVKEFYESLPGDFPGFFTAAKKLSRAMKKAGLSADEVKIARSIILTRKAVEMTMGLRDFDSVACDGDGFLRFVFIGEGKKKAIKKFNFAGGDDIDRFRAFASVESSVIIKLCGKMKNVKRDKKALEWFESSEKSFCDVLRALKMLGIDPVVDMKKLDKYISSL